MKTSNLKVYLDEPIDASEWIYPSDSMEDSRPLDMVLDAMRQMGILNTKVASNRAAAAQLELHHPFRHQLRQALAIRDTSPWKEQVCFAYLKSWHKPLPALARGCTCVGRNEGGACRQQWRGAAQRTVERYRRSSCGGGGSCGGRACCTIW